MAQNRWLVIVRGKQYGPMSSRSLAISARQGRIDRGDLVSREGSSRWVAAEKLPGLFPERAASVEPPAMATRPADTVAPVAAAAPLAVPPADKRVEQFDFQPAVTAAPRQQPALRARAGLGTRLVASLLVASVVAAGVAGYLMARGGLRQVAMAPASVADRQAAAPPREERRPQPESDVDPAPVVEAVASEPVSRRAASSDRVPVEAARLRAASPDRETLVALVEAPGAPPPGTALAAADPVPGHAVPVSMAEKVADLRPFLARHCYECHGPDTQENEIRFDNLSADLSDPVVLAVWQDALDQINLGEMPPQEQPRPGEAELAAATDTLTALLADAYAAKHGSGGDAVARRLNRAELRNTLRDLLYLSGQDLRGREGPELVDVHGNGMAVNMTRGPVRDFPADEKIHGFDTIGQTLVMSDFLLRLIISAAEESLLLATHTEPKPPTEPRTFMPPLRKGGATGLEGAWMKHDQAYDPIFLRYREPGASTGNVGRVAPDEIGGPGVPFGARYRITVEVSAHNQKHPWGEMVESRQDEPMKVGLHIADTRRGGYGEGNPTCQQVGQWEIPGDGSRHTLTHELYLDRQWTPWVGWENAPWVNELKASRILQKFHPDLHEPEPPGDAPEPVKQAYEPRMVEKLFQAGYAGPHVRVHSVTIEPLVDVWPPKSHTALYGVSDSEPVRDLLVRFARRAFREPVEPGEVDFYVKLVEQARAAGSSREEALRAGYTAIIASPRFLYIQSADEGSGRLDPHGLAERLAYFLWSSMPDDELFKLAESGRLAEPEVLREQVDRMLAHENAEEFVRRFVDAWLRLDKLGSMPPEKGGPFRWYWDREMEQVMRGETYTYFAKLLEANGPIRDLIDSDYTWTNERGGTILYDRKDVWGNAFQKVKLGDARRGGVITHPAVLTATANGVDTSPVVRGVWVLESLLGTPPPPPPPNVQPLPPDLREAKTIREALEMHRSQATCNACHRKIDPLGFALENFDAVGKWRESYGGPKNLKVDPSATMANGEQVPDIAAFRAVLVEREPQVTRALCEKFLTYGAGRLMEPGDRGEIEKLAARLAESKGGLRDLVKLVVESEIFGAK